MSARQFFLKEIHFKTPAENAINSLYAPMEAQFYHEDSNGERLVVSVIFMEGRANDLVSLLVKNLPDKNGKSNFITNVDANALLPKNLASYQFQGSITYPPCSQDVMWIVLKQPMSANEDQTEALRSITKANARETQDVANRLIAE